MHRAVRNLPILGEAVHAKIGALMLQSDAPKQCAIIEEICVSIVSELRRQNLSDLDSGFLLDHAPHIHRRIKDPDLGRRLGVV